MSKFKPLLMKEINLFILRKDLNKVGGILYDLKLMEFFSIQKKGFEKFEHSSNLEDSKKLLLLRSTISFLKKFYEKDSNKVDSDPISKTQELKEQKSKIEEKIILIKDNFKRAKIMNNLKIKEKDLKDNDFTIGFISKENLENLKILKKENKLINKYQLDDRIYFTARLKKDQKIPFAFKDFYLPKTLNFDFGIELKEEEKKLFDIIEELKKLSNANLTYLQREELKLSKITSLEEVRTRFNKTQNFTVLSGFAPSKDVKKLKESLESELGNKFDIEIKDAKGENVPTLLNHSGSSENFMSLLKMYSLPKYREFDPTTLMFLVFPLFYGFVLGDFGYGLISLIVFSLAKIYMPKIKEFLNVLQISSISSMIFGILYGEYFGFEPYHLFTRMEHPETLLLISIIFGFIHLNIGLIIGFFNEIKENLKHAIFDKLAWIVLQIGVGLLATGFYLGISIFKLLGGIIFIISAIMLVIGHGIMGIIEIPSFFTNVLSYARLMAVGISSIVIALLVNKYSVSLIIAGPLSAIAGILLFTIGHVFNIVLGNFESFLHTLRLHYVEFFTKFYHGGGREFEPFGKHVSREENE